MATKLSVVNTALSRLGQTPLASAAALAADSTSNAGRVAELHWDDALEELLRAFPWNWAKARTSLPLASPSPLFEWTYAFELPDDYVTLLAINETSLEKLGDWWEIESGYLYTDDIASGDVVHVEYIYKPTESATDAFVDRMDPLARNALVTLLASKIAPAITQDGLNKSDQLLQRYFTVDLAQARLRNAGETKQPYSVVRTESAWDDSRRQY